MKYFLFGLFLIAFILLVFQKQNIPVGLPVASPTQNKIDIKKTSLSLIYPSGFAMNIFAENLGRVRDLEFSPGGTLIASVISNGTIIALPNNNVKTILSNLNNPHGLAFYNNQLYVAEETRVARYNWDEKNLNASLDKALFNLPKGDRHFTRSIVFDNNGNLYISVGSTCDVCNEPEPRYAAVLISSSNGENPRVYASGLRNSVFITINPETNELWSTDMGRDNLGDNIPPDEINIIKDNKNYGWPNCYSDKIQDTSFNPRLNLQDCIDTEPPIYKIQAHSAPLGLTFINSKQFPADWQSDLLVAYHGSWNRSIPTGYKIVRMKVNGSQITREEDFITGFMQNGQTIGRPVDLIFDKNGYLYISDDQKGVIYILGKNI